MRIKTVPHRPYCPDLVPCDFCLFSKLRGCRYETVEEMKEAVTKVIDTLTQEDFHGVFQKLLERYNKCIAAGGNYFEGDYSFMCVLSIKVPIRKTSGNLFNEPRRYDNKHLKMDQITALNDLYEVLHVSLHMITSFSKESFISIFYAGVNTLQNGTAT